MPTINAEDYSIFDLNKINVVLGKNGCGKSTFLKRVEASFSSRPGEFGKTHYISPERGGNLIYSPQMENDFTNDRWMDSRRMNQAGLFREQSAGQFRILEQIVLLEIEKKYAANEPGGIPFNTYIDKINGLLENIEIRRERPLFKIFKKGTDDEISPSNISSGEAELISLGIECLIFARDKFPDKQNVLFLDEPDVHLHPDLQARLMRFLVDLVSENDFTVIIASHSTALLGVLAEYPNASVALMQSGDTEIKFRTISDTFKKILPIFGAHPLSTVFNQVRPLLLEGEDDERIWQQAVKTSRGRLKLYPISNNGLPGMNELEVDAAEVIKAVYDSGVGFSLRDLDDSDGTIADLPPIKRSKLGCRASENLMLSDDVLASLGLNWGIVKSRVDAWLAVEGNKKHSKYSDMLKFQQEGYNRKHFDLKDIRMLLVGSILDSNKPWEIMIGQVIGGLSGYALQQNTEHSIADYLGRTTVSNILT